MSECDHELRSPQTEDEWQEFHNIRRKVLFENRGKREGYIANHPDDFRSSNHPLILIHQGQVTGVCRLDIHDSVFWLRRVAIREDSQRLGHGRVLMQLAEQFARKLGGKEIRTNAAVESVGFYEKCDYVRDDSIGSPPNSESMVKLLGRRRTTKSNSEVKRLRH